MAKKNRLQFAQSNLIPQSKNKFVPGEVGCNNRYPEFSYRFYSHNHKKYSCKCIDEVEEFHEMFERLKAMSGLKWYDIKKARHQYHFHEIEWHETSEPFGFSKDIPRTLQVYPACQFKLFKECRIIGFFNQNSIFEIVWIDRNHEVYPKK